MNPRHTDAARDFAATAHILALARGSVSEARRLAYETGNSRVVDVFERAEPGSLGELPHNGARNSAAIGKAPKASSLACAMTAPSMPCCLKRPACRFALIWRLA